MADYCTLAEALALLPSLGTLRDAATGPPAVTATVPTATQGAAILASVTAEIDMHLRGQGYATPATDAQAVASLKTICMNGVAARIAKAKWPAPQGAGGDQGVAASLREDYLAGLAFIDSGGLAPDSAAEDDSTVSCDFTRPYDVMGSALNGDTDSPF